jgi:hypothetical protein
MVALALSLSCPRHYGQWLVGMGVGAGHFSSVGLLRPSQMRFKSAVNVASKQEVLVQYTNDEKDLGRSEGEQQISIRNPAHNM